MKMCMTIPAFLCEHANEVPQACPCPSDCYCKSHTCKPITPAIEEGGWTKIIGSMPDFPEDDDPPVGAIDPIARLRRNQQDGYDSLRLVFGLAMEQAAAGKGKERHALEGQSFEDQEIVQEGRRMGTNHGAIFQVRKKALESTRLPSDRARAELLGAIVYAAAAYLTVPE